VRIVMIGTLTAFQWLLYVPRHPIILARYISFCSRRSPHPGVGSGDANMSTIDTTPSKCTLDYRQLEATKPEAMQVSMRKHPYRMV
jgi:hypothetical protein